jgi:hypothetical protein
VKTAHPALLVKSAITSHDLVAEHDGTPCNAVTISGGDADA